MEFELFLFSAYDIKYITEMVADIIKNILDREIDVTRNENDIWISCGLFQFNIDSENNDDLDYIRKTFETNINVCIWFEVFNREFEQGIKEVFKIINNLLKCNNDDMLLLYNGGKQVLRRDNGTVIINTDIDYIPYEEIDILYKKEPLETR